jgi:type VI secretion system protein ImpH
MEAAIRSQSHAVNALLAEPHSFDFFQAVRLIEQQAGMPQFRSKSELGFSPASIDKVSVQQKAFTLWVNFMGLTGPSGVLPEHFTELLLERIDQKDYALQDFLDIFNHQLISLFYSSWRNSEIGLSYEQGLSDQQLALIGSLSGQPQALQSQNGISQEALWYYCGLMSQQARSSEGLRAILADYFGLPISLEDFTGEWLPVSKKQMTAMGRHKQYNRLGQDSLIGSRVWHVQNRFTVNVGPLSYPQFEKLLPNGDWLQAMRKLLQGYVGMEFHFTIRLLLPLSAAPACQLRHKKSMQLGWNTWLAPRKSHLTQVSPSPIPESIMQIKRESICQH